jgi:hypothetical protein
VSEGQPSHPAALDHHEGEDPVVVQRELSFSVELAQRLGSERTQLSPLRVRQVTVDAREVDRCG